MPPAQHRTIGDLFGPRRRRPPAHQLGLGVDPPPRHCLACGQDLEGGRTCVGCDAFTCERCHRFTTANGGDGRVCYGCAR